MRTIKFRGKRVDNGEWVYGDLWSMPNDGFAIVDDGNQWCESKEFNPIPVDPETVGEYSGFKNIIKQEFWEGDRVSYFGGEEGKEQYPYEGVVKFRNGCFYIYSQNSIRTDIPLSEIDGINEFRWSYEASLGNHSSLYYVCSQFKLIGTIYDNPELL